MVARREKFLDGWFMESDKLGEGPSLREDLVDQDGADRVDLLMRLEFQQVVGDHPPYAGGLIGLAGIGGDEMLEQWVSCLRHFLVRDGDEVVVHAPSHIRPTKSPILPGTRAHFPAPGSCVDLPEAASLGAIRVSQPTGCVQACARCSGNDGFSGGSVEVTTARTYSSSPLNLELRAGPPTVPRTPPPSPQKPRGTRHGPPSLPPN